MHCTQTPVCYHFATTIKLTVDTYGKWLSMGDKSAVDRLITAQLLH